MTMASRPQALPSPDHDALIQSRELSRRIGKKIDADGGKISFADFMQAALYTPKLGYYMNDAAKFGPDGDFVTAPGISPLFSQCIATQCAQIFAQLNTRMSIIEFGAGTGIMAADILLYLEQLDCLPEYYYIIEISPQLKMRQRTTLQKNCAHLLQHIIWLDELPVERINAIVLANEVLDAMPVELFTKADGQDRQRFVGEKNEQFVFFDAEIENRALKLALQDLTKQGIDFADSYYSEINLQIGTWLAKIQRSLQQGVILLIDYGYTRQEYYHPQRASGTLQCHYQHSVHVDPLRLVGLQDITAHVDFTAVALAAVEIDLAVLGFTSQSIFLLNNNLLNLVDAATSTGVKAIQKSQQIKQLTLPSEMGELFKVLALGKNIEINLQGFAIQDRLHQL